MNAKNLLILANFLETVSANRWNYATILSSCRGVRRGVLACDATACAIGWGTQVPELQAAGLHMKRIYGHADTFLLFNRARRAFELSKDEATYLFIPRDAVGATGPLDATATVHRVAAHIRAFVERGGLPSDWQPFA